ncbi:MAG: phosphosulfolactate phosphohydrolase, partial [Cryobacterium sp.]
SLGIDHCSPEAAAASASFVGLQRALRHLTGASETGQALAAAGRQDEVAAAGRLDDSTTVSTLGEFTFPA